MALLNVQNEKLSKQGASGEPPSEADSKEATVKMDESESSVRNQNIVLT